MAAAGSSSRIHPSRVYGVRSSALILARMFTVAFADTAVFFWARQAFQSSDYTSSERVAQATPWTCVTGRGGTA